MVAHYIKHPPPGSGAGVFGANGTPYDARMAQILQNNTAHMAIESGRQLVWSVGTGTLKTKIASSALAVFSGVTDLVPPTAVAYLGGGEWQKIPWGDRRSSVCFGPFYGIADSVATAGGGGTLRPVVFEMGATVDANLTTKHAIFVLSRTDDGHEIFNHQSYLAIDSGDFTNGQSWVRKVLTPTVAISSPDAYPVVARGAVSVNDANGVAQAVNTYAPVIRYFCWFGWQFIGTDSDQWIDSFSAFETR
jgi:hypothetical protein